MIRSWLRWIAYAGKRRHCPVCGRRARRFLRAGRMRDRKDAMCPWCNSLERHRFVWLYVQRHTGLLERPGRLLHLAPEPALERALGARPGIDSVTSDLEPRAVDVAADLTRLCFRDGSFDWAYCSHVLEHVPSDREAMRELRRVLRADGLALIQVPIRGRSTYEDATITAAEDRLAAFGQEDHVRYYGLDVIERLEGVGFRVATIRVDEHFTPGEMERHGLLPGDLLFACHRHG